MGTIRTLTVALASSVVLAACGAAASGSSAGDATAASPAAGGMESVTPVQQSPQLKDNRPLVLYVGADYCPFCASMRWPLPKRGLLRARALVGELWLADISTPPLAYEQIGVRVPQLFASDTIIRFWPEDIDG